MIEQSNKLSKALQAAVQREMAQAQHLETALARAIARESSAVAREGEFATRTGYWERLLPRARHPLLYSPHGVTVKIFTK